MHNVLENNPHAAEVVREWFISKMEESMKDQTLPENFRSFMREQGVPNDKLVKLIEVNPRVLFDVFDDNNVIINIVHDNGMWSWSVNETKSAQYQSSRKASEVLAVECAFQMLNNKLNITSTENDA